MKKISRRNFLTACAVTGAAAVLGGFSVSAAENGSDKMNGTYSIHVQGGDWGCGVDKAILKLDGLLDAVSADNFHVTETKQTTDFTAASYPIIEVTVERKVTKAYFCNAMGAAVTVPSRYVALEMYISPSEGSPVLFCMNTQYNTWSDPYYLTITASGLTGGGKAVQSLVIDPTYTAKTTSADILKIGTFKASDGVTYNCAYTDPIKSDVLVVWLHGMGEGGAKFPNTDPYLTCLANEVMALAGDEFQSMIGGANLLVPQCPTYWMDKDGNQGNFNGGSIHADGTSYYTESLHELITAYAEKVGASKIVLAGCSNGGYMTMVMTMTYPEMVTAAVPICEAVPDSCINDAQIQRLVGVPMYFVYSEDDTTVDPTKHEIPTIERLRNAGKTNLHVSTTEHVYDLSGDFANEDGTLHQYMGHWSWVYFDNNETMCNHGDECGLSAWEWIAQQVK